MRRFRMDDDDGDRVRTAEERSRKSVPDLISLSEANLSSS